jgi:hypothetical protein
MWEDDELRAAVLAELDAAPPAAGGGLDDVVRRGRRRKRVTHAGAALAVVALLTATGAVATALGGDPLPPAASAPPSEVPWPHLDLPWRSPTGTWNGPPITPPTGDELVAPYPLCAIPDVTHDRLDVYRATAGQQDKVYMAAQVAAPGLRVGILTENRLVSYPEEREGWSYEADLSDAGGTGSFRFGIGDYTGTPLAAADAQAFDVGNCEPPKRHVLADGTVLQLYETRPAEPVQSLTQVLRIFLPNGRLYQVTSQNWGSSDLETNRDQPTFPLRIGQGRATLPLTEAQLAEFGLAILR